MLSEAKGVQGDIATSDEHAQSLSALNKTRAPGLDDGIVRWLVILVCAAALLLPAMYNRAPFLVIDTTAYLRGAETAVATVLGDDWKLDESAAAMATSRETGQAVDEDGGGLTSLDQGIVLSGRSIYYGFLVYLGALLGNLWVSAAIQALIIACCLHLVLVRMWGFSNQLLIGATLSLSIFSPLGYFAGLLMPDILIGVTILLAGAVAARAVTGKDSRFVVLFALAAFACLGHSSHIVVSIGLALLIFLAGAAKQLVPRTATRTALCLAAAALVGVAGELAFNFAVRQQTGHSPLRLPHLAARSIDLGPGAAYAKAHCPEVGFAICAYAPIYPVSWTDFLFSEDRKTGVFAVADAQMKRRISEEQVRFFMAVYREHPAEMTQGLASDILSQIVRFGPITAMYTRSDARHFRESLPETFHDDITQSRIFLDPATRSSMATVTYLSALAGLVAILAYFLVGRLRSARHQSSEFDRFALLALSGVLANAVICAVLSAPFDRFQGRVVWIVPLLGILSVTRLWTGGRSRSERPDAAEQSPTHDGAHARSG